MADDPTGKPAGDPPDPKNTDPGPDYQAESEKWKGFARKHEGEAKAAKEELEKLRAAADTSKSDTDKLTARLAKLETQTAEAEARALRAEVASAKGLPAGLGKRLQGSTREELEADADELLKIAKPSKKDDEDDEPTPKSSGGRSPRTAPKERLRGGSKPDEEPDERDPRKLAASVPRR
jgi:hypothetical protein